MTQILVVDDEVDSVFAFESILKANGFLVDSYHDPIKALSEFRPGYYNLIVLDYRMAALNGREFIENIRALDRSVKAILVTAWELQSLGGEIQKHFVKVLSKPITEEKLVEEVRLALNPLETVDPW